MIVSGSFDGPDGRSTYTIVADDVTDRAVSYSLTNLSDDDIELTLWRDDATELVARAGTQGAGKMIAVTLGAGDVITAKDGAARDKPLKQVLHRAGSPTLRKR